MTKQVADVTMSFKVKGYDIDVGGIVHNSVYLLWLDDIRTEFLEKVQPIEKQVELGYIPVLSKTDISYKRAVRFGDRPVARMFLEHVSRLRWRISCEFTVDGVVTTHAIQEGCLVNIASGRPIQMPEPFTQYWSLRQKQQLEQKDQHIETQDEKTGMSAGAHDVHQMNMDVSVENFDPSEAMVCPV